MFICVSTRRWARAARGRAGAAGAAGTAPPPPARAAAAPHARLRAWSGRRDFLARTLEEAQPASGWDACQAPQARAGEQPLARTAASGGCGAPTQVVWAQAEPRHPALARHVAGEVVPALSTAHGRAVLQAVFPWPPLTLEPATAWVLMPLVHRTRSTRSRLKSQGKPHDSS
jgi:hypothetical protein